MYRRAARLYCWSVRSWWCELECSVGAAVVVVGRVAVQHRLQVVFVDDEQSEPFGVGVGSRTPWGDIHNLDAGGGEDRVGRGGGLAGSVADEEPEAVCPLAEVHERGVGLLGCPGSVGVGGGAEDVDVAGGDFHYEKTYTRLRVTAQSTWKKPQADMLVAWARRNRRQEVSVSRWGAGGTHRRLSTRRTVEAATRWPSLSGSPWILRYPQPVFSRAMRSINAAMVQVGEYASKAGACYRLGEVWLCSGNRHGVQPR